MKNLQIDSDEWHNIHQLERNTDLNVVHNTDIFLKITAFDRLNYLAKSQRIMTYRCRCKTALGFSSHSVWYKVFCSTNNLFSPYLTTSWNHHRSTSTGSNQAEAVTWESGVSSGWHKALQVVWKKSQILGVCCVLTSDMKEVLGLLCFCAFQLENGLFNVLSIDSFFLVNSAIPHLARVIMQLQESFRVDLLPCFLKQRASHPDPTLYITINSNLGALESKVRTKWIVLCCYLQTALFICQKSFLRAGRLCWIEGNRLICDSVASESAPKLNICHFIWHLVVKCHIFNTLS